jgi:neutral ceramidase
MNLTAVVANRQRRFVEQLPALSKERRFLRGQEMKVARFGALLLMVAGFCNFTMAASVKAGVVVVEITPPLTQELSGFGVERRAAAVHDPLFARILLLRTGDVSLAIIASDLHRLQLPGLVDRIGRELGITNTILTGSRNHSAPALDPVNSGTAWATDTEDKLFRGVAEANKNLFSAEIAASRGSLVSGHNVRIVKDNGTVQERWMNPSEEGTAPIDPAVTVLRISEAGGGKLRAILVNYSCQPAILGPDSHVISADYPGALARFVQTELGHDVVCLFTTGASAQVYPFDARLSGRRAFLAIEKMGQRLGQEVVRLVRGPNAADVEVDLKVQQKPISFSNENGNNGRLAVNTVLINRSIALVAVPAELFVEFQLNLSARSPTPITVMVSNAYSSGPFCAGLIPTIAAAVEGGLGSDDNSVSWIGAGEAIVDDAIIQLYRFIGKLDDIPRGRLVVELPDLKSP